MAELRKDDSGLFLCPHCNDPFAAHRRSCALLTPNQRENSRAARLQRQRRLRGLHAPLLAPVQAPNPCQYFDELEAKHHLHRALLNQFFDVPPRPGAPAAPPPPAPAAAVAIPRRPRRQHGEVREVPQSWNKGRAGISDLPAWWDRDPELPSRMCQWCRTIVPKGAVTNHEKLCKDMPCSVWLRGIRMLRANLQTEVKCRQCGTCFLDARGCARHAHEGRQRRLKAGLPVDTGEFHVLPPLAQGVVRLRSSRSFGKGTGAGTGCGNCSNQVSGDFA